MPAVQADDRSGQADRRRPVQVRLRDRHRERQGAEGPRREHRRASSPRRRASPAWMLEWRLEAFRRWKTMTEPTWANVHYPKIDFQNLYYYSAPKSTEGPKSLADVDPELLRTYEKLGIPLQGARDPGRRARRARAWPSTPCSTASPSSPPSRRSWRRPASSSARSRRRCASIPSWCRSIWARWCRSPTTSTPRSTRRCSPTARSSTCRRACAARWSCPPTSASTRRRPASSSARSSSPTRAPTCPTSRAARRRCATSTSCTPPWSS